MGTTTARGPLMPSPRLTPIPMSSTAASAMPATTDMPDTATDTPLSTAATATTTARGALTPSPRLMPTTATTATPAPTVATTATAAPTDTPTTAKCTKDLRSSTGRRDQPTTQQYSMKCDEPTITSKLPKKRPAPCALSLSQSTKLPLAETVLMMSARKKQNTE